MPDNDRLRAVHLRLRETHQKLFDLQGEAIAGLRDVLQAISRTQDEMAKLFAADNDLEDTIDRPPPE